MQTRDDKATWKEFSISYSAVLCARGSFYYGKDLVEMREYLSVLRTDLAWTVIIGLWYFVEEARTKRSIEQLWRNSGYYIRLNVRPSTCTCNALEPVRVLLIPELKITLFIFFPF